MRNKDLEARNNLSQGNRAIVFPFLNGLNVVDKNDEVVFFPMVMNFNLGDVAAGHDYLPLIFFGERWGRCVCVNVFLRVTGFLVLIWVMVEVDGCMVLKYHMILSPSE